MKIFVKKFSCLFITVCILMTTIFMPAVKAKKTALLVGSESACYYVDERDGGILLRSLYPQNTETFLPLDNDFLTAQAVGEFIYVLSALHDESNSIEIAKYSASGKLINTLTISIGSPYGEMAVCIAPNDKVYYRAPENSARIICVDFSGKLIGITDIPQTAVYIYSEPSGEIIVSGESSVFVISGNKVSQYNGASLPILSLGSSYYMGLNGGIYHFSGGFTQTDMSDFYIHSTIGTAGNDSVYIADDNRILAFSNGVTRQFTLDSMVISIWNVKGNIFVLTADGKINSLKDEDFTLVPVDPDDPDDPTDPDVSETDDPYREYRIDSEVYIIDTENSRILNVTPSTSVTAFKKNIDHTFDRLDLFNGGSSFTSGKVSTGLTARFSAGSDTADFTVIVSGDLNSNSECNNADKKLLISHLLGESQLGVLPFLAADMDFDGNVNLSDLLLLSREAKK